MKTFTITVLVRLILSPIATLWVRSQELRILRDGRALTPLQLNWTRALGIKKPERIRIHQQAELKFPSPAWLDRLLSKCGISFPSAAEMSLRYGIFISTDAVLTPRLLCHELGHTLQYERLGGIYAFLNQYLFECIHLGYNNAPMEHEADQLAEQAIAAISEV